MVYFPARQETAYRCQCCGKWFIRGVVSCAVMHAPGTCCHYGDEPIAAPAILPVTLAPKKTT